MSSQQVYTNGEENRGSHVQRDVPQADANKYVNLSPQSDPPTYEGSTHRSGLEGGTDVMGQPVHPSHQSQTSQPSAAQGDIPRTLPANFSDSAPTSSGNFPSAQKPDQAYQSGTSQPPAGQGTNPSPYVQTSSIPGTGGSNNTPMESIMQVFNKWSKKAEDMTGNVWGHLRTGPNVAETALGRIAVGTKAMTGGGLDSIFRQTFEVAPDEHLLKTYACYLSASTGPVAGTLYISSQKLAFCSDRPLAIPSSPPAPDNNTAPPASSPTKTSSAAHNSQQQQQWCYYKVVVPISQLDAVTPSENTQKKPPEKYVQVRTVDGHEFWFMGFVNYDKGVKNLQDTLLSKSSGAPTDGTNAHTDTNAPSLSKTYDTPNDASTRSFSKAPGTNTDTRVPSHSEVPSAPTDTNAPSYDN